MYSSSEEASGNPLLVTARGFSRRVSSVVVHCIADASPTLKDRVRSWREEVARKRFDPVPPLEISRLLFIRSWTVGQTQHEQA